MICEEIGYVRVGATIKCGEKCARMDTMLWQGRIKEERACNLGNIRIHMWAGECA